MYPSLENSLPCNNFVLFYIDCFETIGFRRACSVLYVGGGYSAHEILQGALTDRSNCPYSDLSSLLACSTRV